MSRQPIQPQGRCDGERRQARQSVALGHETVFLFLGRLVEKKGLTYLLQALAGAGQSLGDWTLVIAGHGPLSDELRGSAVELGIDDRVRFAGEEPLAIDRIWLPSGIADQLLDADFTHTSLYNELERAIGKRPNEGWERIHPAVPTADERECLHLDEGEAVFSIERLGTFNGEPIEWRVTTIRGDRFTFVADWTAGQRNELRLQMVNG